MLPKGAPCDRVCGTNVSGVHLFTFADPYGMSALPPKADIERHEQHVRFVPLADIAVRDYLVAALSRR